MRTPYDQLGPAAQALSDYQQGGDQNSNPYRRESQPGEWWAYALAMHKLQAHELVALIQQAEGEPNEYGGKDDDRDANTITGSDDAPPF